jgi:hypothetical protein
MIDALVKLLNKKPKFVRCSKDESLFDGWAAFIRDAVSSANSKKNAYKFIEDENAIQYELDLRDLIAHEIFYRTSKKADPERIMKLQRSASHATDYERQLAYLVFCYEGELNEPVTTVTAPSIIQAL